MESIEHEQEDVEPSNISAEDTPAARKRKNPFNTQKLKEEKERRQKKRARLIIRNISYKATQDSLRAHFQKFGDIEDLNLLKRADGKLVGCAFVQYASVNQATKAILQGNNQPFLGRPVFVDWAMGKNEYTAQKKDVKQEEPEEKKPKIELENVVKDADDSEEDKEHAVCGNDAESEDEENGSIKSEDEVDAKDESEEENSAAESNDEDDEDSKEDKKDLKSKLKPGKKIKSEKHISNDVQEGCTVFIKNVPFDATDNDLRKVCRKFGPLYYAIINRDRVSGHSKGTAFIKFKTKESADLCLQAGTEFTLLDQFLDPHPAMSREEINTQSQAKDGGESKDSRSLYLAREGLIMSGSKAAEGVSASDMTRRHKLEQVKTQVLKNLNRFVSRNRLSIHNLPNNYDNDKLQKMVISYTGFRPHECRVMRENKVTPDNPNGKSKGFGFMSFNKHEEALEALRKLNNNPTVFGDLRRPIVAFSIEDRAVHRVKEQRTDKSKFNNPTYQKKLEQRKEKRKLKLASRAGEIKKFSKGPQSDDKTKLKQHIKQLEETREAAKAGKSTQEIAPEFDNFVGMAGKPGTVIRMRSNKKIREQATEHMKRVKTDKRKEKHRKIKQEHLAERKAVIRPKQGRKQEHDDLSLLVNKYKRMIDTKAAVNVTDAGDAEKKQKKPKRTKWYKE